MNLKRFRKQITAAALAAALCASLCACANTPATQTGTTAAQETTAAQTVTPSSEHRKVIIDTDTGADDASALILAAKQKNVEILGVTVLVGNVDLERSTKNALAALELDPNEVELIVLGPATNIAKAIQKAPEEMKKVKRIWSMGTAGLGPGNASPVAEFNVYADAAAYKIMLDSGLPITVIGLDMCDGAAQWTDAQIEQLEALNGTGSFVAKSFGKIREFYKANGSETVMNCDSLAMMCALYPDFVKSTVNTHASCLTEEGEAYSQVIFYKEGFTYDVVKNDFAYNTVLVTEVNKDAYFNTYLEAIK